MNPSGGRSFPLKYDSRNTTAKLPLFDNFSVYEIIFTDDVAGTLDLTYTVAPFRVTAKFNTPKNTSPNRFPQCKISLDQPNVIGWQPLRPLQSGQTNTYPSGPDVTVFTPDLTSGAAPLILIVNFYKG